MELVASGMAISKNLSSFEQARLACASSTGQVLVATCVLKVVFYALKVRISAKMQNGVRKAPRFVAGVRFAFGESAAQFTQMLAPLLILIILSSHPTACFSIPTYVIQAILPLTGPTGDANEAAQWKAAANSAFVVALASLPSNAPYKLALNFRDHRGDPNINKELALAACMHSSVVAILVAGRQSFVDDVARTAQPFSV